MTELTVREGDGDARRTGYWIVTGPQPADDVYAIVERTRRYLTDGGHQDGFSWYLHQRQPSEADRGATFVATVRHGETMTREGALAEVRTAWAALIGFAAPVSDDTGPVTYPWQAS